MNTLKRNYGLGFPALLDEFLKPDFVGMQHLGMKIPAVNIKENEQGFTLELAAPGLKKTDFNLELNQGALTIFVENKKTESETVQEKYTRREFQYGAFKRTFTLPENIDEEAISANYTDGILNIQLPLKKETQQNHKRLIEIA
jgi:HSP20 family protein